MQVYHRETLECKPPGFLARERARMEVAGGVVTVTASTAYGRMPGTLRIDADHYVILETGEVREMEHGDK